MKGASAFHCIPSHQCLLRFVGITVDVDVDVARSPYKMPRPFVPM